MQMSLVFELSCKCHWFLNCHTDVMEFLNFTADVIEIQIIV